MIRRRVDAAPVRHLVRAGAVVILACVGCDRVASSGGDQPRVLELTHDTIQLSSEVTLVEIRVERSDSGEFEPPEVEARQGDVIRFTAQDRGAHAIAFDDNPTDASVRDYLDRTGQLRSPPLIAAGSAWVITLEGAPAGEYAFRCTTHNVAGRLTVRVR